MKRNKILWGLAMLALALALILNMLGVDFGLPAGLSAWQLIMGLLCAFWIVRCCLWLKFTDIFFPLVINVWVFESEIAEALGQVDGDLAPWWVFILLAVLLTGGSKLLFGRHCKSGKWSGKWTGKGAVVRYIDCSQAFSEHIENEFSTYTVYFANVDQFCSGSTLSVDNSFGTTVLHVPADWVVTNKIDNSFGSIKIENGNEAQDGTAKVLHLVGDNSFGTVVVQRG